MQKSRLRCLAYANAVPLLARLQAASTHHREVAWPPANPRDGSLENSDDAATELCGSRESLLARTVTHLVSCKPTARL